MSVADLVTKADIPACPRFGDLKPKLTLLERLMAEAGQNSLPR
jgi:hypothetical protein